MFDFITSDLINSLFFYSFAGLAILSALCAVFLPRIVYNITALVVCFLSIAGIFFLLNADFIGLAQILIYAVALSIIFIFAIMLTGKEEDKKAWISFSPKILFSIIASGGLFMLIVFCITNGFTLFSKYFYTFTVSDLEDINLQTEPIKIMGANLLTKYTLPFEILSILILIIIFGVAILANKDNQKLINPTTKDEEEK